MAKQKEHGIVWTDVTWNPIRGCSRVSEGCRNCYAERVAARFSGPGQPYEGLARRTPSGPRWTGKVRLVEEHLLDPIRWKNPRRIFVNSMSDLFHDNVADETVVDIFAVCALCPQHIMQILTKRARRMQELLSDPYFEELVRDAVAFRAHEWGADRHAEALGGKWVDPQIGDFGRVELAGYFDDMEFEWPLRNVHLGVSVEDQATADERIPMLLQTPAATRFVSIEPMLGPVDQNRRELICKTWRKGLTIGTYLDWVICGGESGPGARPMHPDWARSLRDQCRAAEVPFFFKQWGEWAPVGPLYSDDDTDEHVAAVDGAADESGRHAVLDRNGAHWERDIAQPPPGTWVMKRVGKRAAGRVLDGRTWDEFPEEQHGR